MSCHRFSCRLPGRVGMGQLVDEHHGRPPGDHGVHVELLEHHPAVFDLSAGEDLQPFELGRRAGAPVRLHEADDDVRAPFGPPPRLVEHCVRLAYSRRRSEIDP